MTIGLTSGRDPFQMCFRTGFVSASEKNPVQAPRSETAALIWLLIGTSAPKRSAMLLW